MKKIYQKTDKLFMPQAGEVQAKDFLKFYFDFVCENQLYDEDLWALLVKQFTYPSDDVDNGWRGEFWGKLMRGASFVYTATGDERLYDILTHTVNDLLKTQDSSGRICTYSREKEFTAWDMWCRKYVLLGLEYFYDICKSGKLKEEIVSALEKHAGYIVDHVGNGDGKININKTSKEWYGLNSSSILEPMVRLYVITGNRKFLDFADYIVSEGGMTEDNIFERAYQKNGYPYEYPATKAYEMMSCFEGLLEYSRVTGNKKWEQAVINFADMISETEITVIGSAGCTHELFDHSAVRQLEENESGIMQETCVTVTWLKLCSQLLRLTGDIKYAELMERTVYNALTGCVNTELRHENMGMIFDSYSPLINQSRGRGMGGMRILELFNLFGCCTAIAAAGIGLMGLYPIMKSRDSIVINSYISAAAEFEINGAKAKISMDTKYPADNIVYIKIEYGNNLMKIRIPQYSESTVLLLNGRNIECTAGEYAEVNVKSGDRIILILDFEIRVIIPSRFGAHGNSINRFALASGPLILAKDSRVCEEINKATDIVQKYKKKDNLKVPCITAFECDDDNDSILIDYSSAGKTWNKDSKLSVWFER